MKFYEEPIIVMGFTIIYILFQIIVSAGKTALKIPENKTVQYSTGTAPPKVLNDPEEIEKHKDRIEEHKGNMEFARFSINPGALQVSSSNAFIGQIIPPGILCKVVLNRFSLVIEDESGQTLHTTKSNTIKIQAEAKSDNSVSLTLHIPHRKSQIISFNVDSVEGFKDRIYQVISSNIVIR